MKNANCKSCSKRRRSWRRPSNASGAYAIAHKLLFSGGTCKGVETMNPEFNTEEIGEQLGRDGVGSVVTKVEEYCAHEMQRITLTNEAPIMALRAEGTLLLEEERDLAGRLRH